MVSPSASTETSVLSKLSLPVTSIHRPIQKPPHSNLHSSTNNKQWDVLYHPFHKATGWPFR
jgi:hypothetical protein